MKGYRGYINSNMMERSVPQNVQQAIIRSYCDRNGYTFLLSATEYMLEGCTRMLDAAMKEDIDGIVMYSLWCMPKCKEKRQMLYEWDKPIHFAAENMKCNKSIEDIFMLRAICQK
jgi:sporadic carbohydrate cluster protein (TIGR04323 family)